MIVGNKFDTEEIRYYSEFLLDYYLLVLSKNRTRLLRGCTGSVREITDKNFPAEFSDDFEYAKPWLAHSVSYSLKGANEKSNIELKRLESFLRQVDENLNPYLRNGSKLIVAGVTKNLSKFKQISHHNKNIIGTIHGNFDYHNDKELASLASNEIQKYTTSSNERILETFKDMMSTASTLCGFNDISKAAVAGKIAMLLLDKESRGYNELTESVVIKGGKVVFLENGELDSFGHIAAILR